MRKLPIVTHIPERKAFLLQHYMDESSKLKKKKHAVEQQNMVIVILS